jgi:ABC-type antimicrobial peptide transport system permease subunit
VAAIFSGESYLLGGLGIAIGLGLGVGLAHLVSMAYNTGLYRFPAIVTPSRLVMSAALMAVFVGVAQAIVTIAVRRHDWLEALKSRE